MPRVLILGAGLSGLAAAHALKGYADVTLVDRAARTGGVVGTRTRDGFTFETGPNGFLDTNPATLDLARDVGLGPRLLAASDASAKNRYLFLGDRLRLLPSSMWSLVGTDLLSWPAKFRILTERFRPRSRHSRDESVFDFIARRVGREIAHTLADAFVTGILAGDPRQLSAEACFPRLVAFERDHGSILGGMAAARLARKATGAVTARATMWSFPGGLGELIDAVTAALPEPPRLGVGVRSLARRDATWRAETDDGAIDADAVLLTTPAHVTSSLLAPIDEALSWLIGGIRSNRVAVVTLGFRRDDIRHPLDGFGYLCPQRLGRDVLGVQWCSSIFPGRAPAGHVLMRALCGGTRRGDLLDLDDATLTDKVLAELARALGVQGRPVMTDVIRWERAIPQYTLGHPDKLARIDDGLARLPGLFLGGTAFRGVAMNDCVGQGGVVAARIRAFLSSGTVV